MRYDLFGLRRFLAQRRLTGTLSLEPMWFLRDSSSPVGNTGLSDFVKRALEDIRTRGLAIVPGNVPHEVCDALVLDFDDYCAKHPESADYRDEFSLHERLACLHLVSEPARRVVFNPVVEEIVEAAFRAPFIAVGSLFFEKGSTQSIHRDTPAFFTNPLNHFLGVWTALEDVREGAGPLTYYRGGHAVALDAALYLDPGVTSANYFQLVEQACRNAGLERVEFYPKKGDTLIWHPQLPHGGAPITNPALSRRSIVAHYIPKGIPIDGADVFFSPRKKVATSPAYKTLKFGKFESIDLGSPRFFHNRYEGNFDEH